MDNITPPPEAKENKHLEDDQQKLHKEDDHHSSSYYIQQAYDKAHAYVESYAEKMKGKTGIRRIINALYYSWDGLKAAYEESGFRQLVWMNVILLIINFQIPVSLEMHLLLFMVSFSTMIVELLNTGIEAAVDHTSQEKHDLAKRAKDVGSAAQYMTLGMMIILWVMALLSII